MKQIKTKTLSIIILLVSFACVMMWRVNTGLYQDDLLYEKIWPADENYLQAPFIQTFSDACESAYHHYLLNNGRLTNIICIFSMLVPRWFVNVVDACMTFAMLMLILNVSKVRVSKVRARVVMLAVTLFWTCFSWYNSFRSTDFLVNYVWSSVAMLLTIKLFNSRRHFTRGQMIAAVAFVFFAGMMHEGFMCAMVAYAFLGGC